MFESQMVWLFEKLNLLNVQKLEKAENPNKLQSRPFTIEVDGKDIAFNERKVKNGKLLWGKLERHGQIFEESTELNEPLNFSDTQKPAFLCIRGIPESVVPQNLLGVTNEGAAAVNWRQFSAQINALLDEKSIVNQNQARMELVGMQDKGDKKKAQKIVAALLLGGLALVIIYVVFIDPEAVPAFWEGTSKATQGLMQPK